MNPDPARTARYARALERALAAASGRAVVLSPRDFALLTDWLARGVPLALVLEQVEHRKAKGRDVKSLASIAGAVEQAWSAVVDGRMGGTPAAGTPAPAATRPAVDDATLLERASPRQIEDAERAADALLAPWRGRMTPEAYAQTRRRAILDRLRDPRS